MITTDSIRTNPRIDEATATYVADLWNTAYPTMRHVLDTVINANRAAERPVVDVRHLERTRRELGQLDRGTYTGNCPVTAMFVPSIAFSLVGYVIDATWIGHPQAGDIYRLAAELADLTAAGQPGDL